jgi:hypothetical protein
LVHFLLKRWEIHGNETGQRGPPFPTETFNQRSLLYVFTVAKEALPSEFCFELCFFPTRALRGKSGVPARFLDTLTKFFRRDDDTQTLDFPTIFQGASSVFLWPCLLIVLDCLPPTVFAAYVRGLFHTCICELQLCLCGVS